MEHLAKSGVRTIVANTHPRPDEVESALKASCPRDLELRFSREATLLGTGGGLRKAYGSFDDAQASVIVMNGDTLFAPDLAHACAEHHARGAVATMILRRTSAPERFGAIGIDSRGWVRSLLGTPDDARVREALMFTGVHILSPEAFSVMPESGCVIRIAYRRWVDAGAPVLAIVDDSPWADLGTVSEYHRLNLELASGSFAWPSVEPREGCILPASLEPSGSIRRSVVGADVEIGEGVTLERCVVWPGTRVTRSASKTVITPEHRIEVS
jgi:NDP-sugar pyrophosphorylase family protein